MKKLSLLIFIFLLGFIVVNDVSAKTYKFACGFSTKERYYGYCNKYSVDVDGDGDSEEKINCTPPKFDSNGVLTQEGYYSDIWLEFERTGYYDVKVTKCWELDGKPYLTNDDFDGDWMPCVSDKKYNKFVFKYNSVITLPGGAKEADMSKPWYCPEAIILDKDKLTIENVSEVLKDLKGAANYYYVSEDYADLTTTVPSYYNDRTEEKDIIEIDNVCSDYKYEQDCKNSPEGACIWNKEYKYCNVDKLLYIKCGDAKDIPHQVPQIVSFAVNFLKILTPIILIFISIISLLKAVSASNEDEIKKAQKGLIRKIIAAVMVFFVITIVQFVIMKVADSEIESKVNKKTEDTNLSICLNCFLNNECEDSLYYKTYKGSDLTETFLNKK